MATGLDTVGDGRVGMASFAGVTVTRPSALVQNTSKPPALQDSALLAFAPSFVRQHLLAINMRVSTIGVMCMVAGVTLAACLTGTGAAAGSDASADGNVVVMSSENFESLTASGVWLVEFYAPWCGHCKRLAPTYEKVAKDLAGVVGVAKVDATEDKALASRFPLTGYPTIYLVDKDGAGVIKFTGSRTRGAIKAFATNGGKGGEPLSYISSPWSPVSLFKGFVVGQDNLAHVASVTGLPPAGVVILGGLTCAAILGGLIMLLIILCGGVETPHAHRD